MNAAPLPTEGRGTAIVGFCLRFALLAPLCLMAWWWLVPAYGWLLGNMTAWLATPFSATPIESVALVREGLFNTASYLEVRNDGKNRQFAIGLLVTNIAPFAALVLATGKLGIKRRLRILTIGVCILALCHLAFMTVLFAVGDSAARVPRIAVAVGQVFITLPFLLWIVLAYRDQISEWFSGNDDGG